MLIATDGKLKLETRGEKNKKIKIIDLFFSSLGVVHESFAVGIILSGTLDDGTLGLKVIKASGGITFVQDDSAAFEGMPQNAINSGSVDFVLPPDRIVEKLIEINHALDSNSQADNNSQLHAGDENLVYKQILGLLRSKYDVDLTYYKSTTIKRRIARRMALNKNESTNHYLQYLQENKKEQDALFNDLFISVTDFFRDSKTFEVLCSTIIPQIIDKKPANEPVRIWVAGCATGEEAYSIAICLHEILGDKATTKKIQIFSTDISEAVIAKARTGIYKAESIKNVSPDRLSNFFTKVDGSYQVNKNIRQSCIFARHNLLKDPPFSRIDLISCRNVLIYFEPVLQKKAFTIFHYALNLKGVLVLGKSETTGSSGDLFLPADNKEKIYFKKGDTGRFMNVTSAGKEQTLRNFDTESSPVQTVIQDVFKKADSILLLQFMPAGVLVNDELEIVQFRGVTSNWLLPSPGKPSFNLLKMAREELAFELRSLLLMAKTNQEPVKKEDIPIKVDGKDKFTTIEVVPVKDVAEPHFLVLFRNTASFSPAGGEKIKGNSGDEKTQLLQMRIEQLEKELAQNRSDMRTITEDQETSNEELQSINEELLSGSEELQSLNEELETSKEEIQSTNEELISLNHELVDRNEQLGISRKFAEGLFSTIRDALVVLDSDCKILNATQGFYNRFQVTEKEMEGKSFFEVMDFHWHIPDLKRMLENISPEKNEFSNFELIQTFPKIGQRELLLNGRQIERVDGQKMILLAIEDITDKRRVEEVVRALQKSNTQLEYSNTELDQFASVASHDLQEPLRKVITFANIIEQKNLDVAPETKTFINKIVLAARRMESIINNLLNYSKINGIDQTFIPVDLGEIIKNITNDFELKIQEKNAQIIASGLPSVSGIPLFINQLFYNLMSNALKFSKKDIAPVITIYAAPVTPENVKNHTELNPELNYTEIVVRDNGIGFSEEYSEKIFHLFQRLNGRHEYEGTGLGLSLCRKIVLQHHGKIEAKSKPDEGAAFHVFLPVKQI